MELLRSHDPPTEDLPSTISALSDELARYDDEISRLRAQLSTLESDRAALHAHHTACKSVLAPIRRLPTELMAGIFALCPDSFWPHHIRDRPISRLAPQTPVTLSKVCVRWRDIIVGTPILWNRINLYLSWWEESKIGTTMTSLQFILECGEGSPLHLKIGSEAHIPALDLLTAHSERWKSVEIVGSSTSDIEYLVNSSGDFPLLQDLVLDIWDYTPKMVDLFKIAPNLQYLRVAGPLLPKLVVPPLQKLQQLTCTGLTATEIPGAVSLFSRPGHPFGVCLREIQVGGWPTGDECLSAFGAIFAALTLPILQELSFYSMRSVNPFGWAHAEFCALSARSAFHDHLLTLRLTDVMIEETELLEILAALPLLQRLSIADHQVVEYEGQIFGTTQHLHLITDTLLSALARSADTPSIVPHLRHLSCRSLLQFDDNLYLDFLLSRLQAARPFEAELRWLLGRHRELDPGVDKRLQELRIQKKLLFSFEQVHR
ncbi:hypothetical protein B0H11DRAFT_2007768 [Mycena galericulata]|nr:hypothetical protein B0H11DRAFT_2007768 [Mycena galericulata]